MTLIDKVTELELMYPVCHRPYGCPPLYINIETDDQLWEAIDYMRQSRSISSLCFSYDDKRHLDLYKRLEGIYLYKRVNRELEEYRLFGYKMRVSNELLGIDNEPAVIDI